MVEYRRIALTLLASTALIAPSLARAATPAPKFTALDDHGVDLVTGLPFFSIEEGGIGSGPGSVSMQRIWAEGAGWQNNWTGGLYRVTSGGVTKIFIQFAGISDTFSGSGTTWTSDKADGATLTVDAQDFYNYTANDGTKVRFDAQSRENQDYACPGADPTKCQIPLSITRPDGLKFTLVWAYKDVCVDRPGEPCYKVRSWSRLSGVSSSAGYSMAIAYVTNGVPGAPPPSNWWDPATITFNNSANPPSPTPTISYAYPASGVINVTDPGGRTWVFTVNASGQLTGIRRPGSASENITYTYTSGLVTASTKDGVANGYSRSVAGTIGTMTVTNPLSQTNVIVSDLNIGRPTSFKDGLNRTAAFQYDGSARLTRTTAPEGNYTQLAYDARGNVTTMTDVAKVGSGLANIVTSASFDSTCTNVVKCNLPNTTTDAKGNVTNYTYDATHGGVTSVKLPAPAVGADRPETRLSFTPVTSQSGDLVYMLTGTSACASGTAPSCVGTASESKASAAYNSNLLATSVSKGDGTGALTATSAMTYDPRGNLLTVDGPLGGTADTTAFKYDAADQLVGTISSDPDGAGALLNRAIRITYRPDGQVSKRELGTTAGQSQSAWDAFSSAQEVQTAFDDNSHPIRTTLASGGTAYSVTQLSYDELGRLQCGAVRMTYVSLPASACTQQTPHSTFGPDRISQLVYDAAAQITQINVAVGTSDEAPERTLTYSANGQLATLKDGENNLTTFEYDGFDRLSKTRFPVVTKGANSSSTTDYEQLTYDANSNATSRRLRDGGSMSFTYDNLDRLTVKGPPNPDPTVTFGYDGLGRMTSAAKSAIGISLAFTYDALGRKLTETGPQGPATSEYDLADRRTKLTYPGTGLFVNTDYLVTGEVTQIRENGATSGVGLLATYAYNPAASAGQFGLPTSVTFGNGVVQGFGYDPVLRLTSLTNDLSGSANDLTVTVGGYNPASQITGVTRSSLNDAYAFTGYSNGTTATVSNGLNQQVSIGGTSATWDSKGNLASDPTSGKSYTYYPSTNQLWTVSSPFTAMSYDGLDRLAVIDSTADTKFAYDGLDTLAEYDGSNALQKRYVFGPGMDEPIVEYDASGNRRFLSADERGSIISASDSSAALLGINTYDEYGRPGAANSGRFQYTGQKWIGEAGLYDYKARAYLPQLGIFAQTDPIGFDAGANLYAYVLDDPIGLIDPTGLLTCIQDVHWVGGFPYFGRTFCIHDPAGTGSGAITGGGPSGDRPDRRNSEPRSKPRTASCGQGQRLVISPFGLGGTGFLFIGGFSVGVEAGVSIPFTALRGNFRGIQAYGSVSFVQLLGLGAFVGGGPNYGAGIRSGPIRTGATSLKGPPGNYPALVAQGGAAWMAGGEGQISVDSSSIGASGGGGPRTGYGAYVAGGVKHSATLATPELCY